jgi:hypothetical protein
MLVLLDLPPWVAIASAPAVVVAAAVLLRLPWRRRGRRGGRA